MLRRRSHCWSHRLSHHQREAQTTNNWSAPPAAISVFSIISLPCASIVTAMSALLRTSRAPSNPARLFHRSAARVPFTLKILRASLPPKLVTDYEAKQAKIAAACSLLCAEPGCRVIIPEDKIVDDVGHCPACNRNTCVKYRTAQHEGKDCPTDEERRRVVELAKDKKWQVCYQCNNMIELNVRCNRMT